MFAGLACMCIEIRNSKPNQRGVSYLDSISYLSYSRHDSIYVCSSTHKSEIANQIYKFYNYKFLSIREIKDQEVADKSQ